MKYCSNCGAQLSDSTKFCQNCGQKVEAPTQPAPEAPQQTYTPPVQQGYEAQQQSYTPPMQQDYEASQQSYTPPVQQNYEAPQQSYTPPVQADGGSGSYVPPMQSGGGSGSYVPPVSPANAPKEKKPFNRNIILFAGIGAVAILIIVLLVSCLSRKGGKDDGILGRYEGVSCTMSGLELGADGEWIELKANGKVSMLLVGEGFDAKWSLDGEDFTLTQSGDEFKGTLKDGVLTIDLDGMIYTFAKDGATVGSGQTAAGGDSQPAAGAEEAGYWTLLRVDSDSPDMAVSEDDIALFKELGIESFLDLCDDKSCVIALDTPVKGTWGDGKITAENGESLTYTLADGLLHITLDGADYVFTRGEGSAPQIDWNAVGGDDYGDDDGYGDDGDYGEDLGAYSWWSGTWYGWVVISNANSAYEGSIDNCYDLTAEITVYDDGTGYVDMTYIDDEYLGWASVSFGAGTTENGCMMSEEGVIFGLDLGYADWIVDPGASMVSCFDHMIHIDATMYDEDGDWFDYDFFLRPWGMDWEDVRVADTSGMLYDDMMPLYYDDWYLPQLESGAPSASRR